MPSSPAEEPTVKVPEELQHDGDEKIEPHPFEPPEVRDQGSPGGTGPNYPEADAHKHREGPASPTQEQ